MRLLRWPALALLFALGVSAGVAACGGGGSGEPQASRDAPTATLPDPLPDVRIVGQATARPSGDRYVVQEGDNPSSIAAQFSITVEALLEANGIVDPTSLYVGQELIIPGGGEPQPTPAPTEEPPPEDTPVPTQAAEGQVYIVQEGDIPETIAAQFDITADELMAANGITDPASLFIGQELIIPTPTPE